MILFLSIVFGLVVAVCLFADGKSKKSRLLTFGDLSSMLADKNVRSDSETARNAKRLATSIASGYQAEYPLVVEELEGGKLRVLKGHGRRRAVLDLGADAFAQIAPNGVPAIVLTGLTDAERDWIVTSDFSRDAVADRGTEWALYQAVKRLMASDPHMTEDGIARHLGQIDAQGKARRSFMQPRAALAKMAAKCPDIEEEMRKNWDPTAEGYGNAAFPVAAILGDFYPRFNADRTGRSANERLAEYKQGLIKSSAKPSALTPGKVGDIAAQYTSEHATRLLYAACHKPMTEGGTPEDSTDVAADIARCEQDAAVLAYLRGIGVVSADAVKKATAALAAAGGDVDKAVGQTVTQADTAPKRKASKASKASNKASKASK